MITDANLVHLTIVEQQALTEFIYLLQKQFPDVLQSVILFGSKARGDSTPESDIDVLIIVDSDDWRLHTQIRYLAVDISLKYDLFELSPRIWSVAHLQKMAEMEAMLYLNIRQDGVNLLDTTLPPFIASLLDAPTPA